MQTRTRKITVTSPCESRALLYQELQPLVQKLIRKYGTNSELRQELRGEIYCRFNMLLDAYEPERGVPLKPYMIRQLVSSTYSYARRQWRTELRDCPLDLAANFTVSKDPSADWDNHILINQAQDVLPKLLAQLSLRQRQVVIWRYYEQRPYEEIAELLGVKPQTVRSLVRHGINNLRRQYSALGTTL